MPEEFPDVIIDFRGMKSVKDSLVQALHASVVTLSAMLAEATMDHITVNNQVDTGAMRASTFIDVDGSGTMTVRDREEALKQGLELSKHPGIKSGEPQEDFQAETDILWNPEGPFQGKVALGAEYAKWQEKRLKFMAPAYDYVKGRSAEVATDIFKKVLRKK